MLAPFLDKSYKTFTQGMPPPKYPPSKWIDEEYEIWACSPGAYGRVQRCTRFFELHRWEPGAAWFSPEYVQWLCEFEGPVYTGGVIPEIKNHVLYPLARVEAEFSSYFLTSSLSLMLAVAILEIEDTRKAGKGHPEGKDTIGMFGVDMAATEEWAEQRPGCQFFILEALRRGIRIYLPEESDLLRPMPVYGLSEWDHRYIKSTARMRELNGRLQAAQKAAGDANQELHFIRGAVDDMTWNVKTWCNPYGLPAGVFVKQDPGTGMGGPLVIKDDIPMASAEEVAQAKAAWEASLQQPAIVQPPEVKKPKARTRKK